ncbi:MAG: Zn-dependent alcohol dehydrogenase [Acidimicrobiales bacterium]
MTGSGRVVRAAVARGVGDTVRAEAIELAPTGPRQVRVRLAASGVCHSDLSVLRGTLPFVFPTVLGHEGAGVVEEVGEQVTRVGVGDHVVLGWNPPCRYCFYCLAGQPMLCEVGLADSLGSPYGTLDGEPLVRGLGVGAFAEATLVPEGSAVRVDPAVPLDLAALVGCALATGVGSVLNVARVPAGSSVAVVGCGGVGLCVVQGALLAGAGQVIALDRVAAKAAMAVSMGATAAVDASAQDPLEAVRALTGGRGPDYVFEVVGRPETIRLAYSMVRRGGTAVVVGAGSADDQVAFNAMELFADAKTLVGSVYGSADPDRDFPMLVGLIQSGALDPGALVTRRIGLDEVDGAFAAMEAGEVARSVIVFDDP